MLFYILNGDILVTKQQCYYLLLNSSKPFIRLYSVKSGENKWCDKIGVMFYQSPTYGKVDLEQLKNIVSKYMGSDKKARYEIIVGSDSQKAKDNIYDFVSALIIHRVGAGGIYFWTRIVQDKKISLKERIYQEATMSLITAENFIQFFKQNGIAKYDIQIHVDIGHKGETRELITEVVGMIRGSGYDVKIKPDSFGASKVADRYT